MIGTVVPADRRHPAPNASHAAGTVGGVGVPGPHGAAVSGGRAPLGAAPIASPVAGFACPAPEAPTMPRRTVLLLHSNEQSWSGVSAMLGAMDDVRIVGATLCPVRGKTLAGDRRPDAILAATRLGALAAPRLLIDLQRGPCAEAKIVLFSAEFDPDDVAATAGLRYDAWFLWRELVTEGLPHLLRAILIGGVRAGSPSVVDALIGVRHAPEPRPPGRPDTPVRFSAREREVIALLAHRGGADLSLAELAERLGVGRSTVVTYLDRIAAKLGLAGGGRIAVVAALQCRGIIG